MISLQYRLSNAAAIARDEREAGMVSNLATVLCAESEVQPVIHNGTLYN
jgi:hypothetical protein